jgi:gliding motility-associated-like protein
MKKLLLAFTILMSLLFNVDKANAQATVQMLATPGVANGPEINYFVVFSRSVTGLTKNNFKLKTTGVIGADIVSLQGTGSFYNIIINTGTGNGTIALEMINANGLSQPISTHLPLTGATYTIDKSPVQAAITAITRASPEFSNNAQQDFNVNFDKPITGLSATNFDITSTIPNAVITNVSTPDDGTNWIVTVDTHEGEGNVTLNFVNATDLSYPISTSLPVVGETYTIDRTPPTVVISAPIKGKQGPIYTVTYVDPNLGTTSLAPENIILNKIGEVEVGAIHVTGSAGTYTVRLIDITGNGRLAFSIAAGIPTDAANNAAPESAPSAPFRVGETAAITAISRNSAQVTASQTVDYTVTFDTNVVGLTKDNFEISSPNYLTGTISLTGSGAIYTVSVNDISNDGELSLNLVNTTGISPLVITPMPFAGDAYIIDRASPAVGISGPKIIKDDIGATYVYNVVYYDDHLNPNTNSLTVQMIRENLVTAPGVSINNIEVTSAGNDTQTVTFSGVTGLEGEGFYFSVPAGVVADNAGNLSTASDPSPVGFIDNAPPVITIYQPSATSTGNLPVTYDVSYSDANFKEATLTEADIDLIKTGNAEGTVTVASLSGDYYRVTINDIRGLGTLGISIKANTASDIFDHRSLASDPSATFEVVAPDVKAIVVNGSPVTASTTVYFSVKFNTYVSGLTVSNFNLNTIGILKGAEVINVSGEGSEWLVAVNTGDGEGTISLNLVNAQGILPALGTALPFEGETYTIDRTGPTVTITGPVVSKDEYSTLRFEYIITYNDANLDPNSYESPAWSNTVNYGGFNPFAVGLPQAPVDNMQKISIFVTGEGSLAFSVPAGIIKDSAGNPSTASALSPAGVPDVTPPTVTISSPSVNSTGKGPVTYTVTYNDDNFSYSILSINEIELHASGDATCNVTVENTGINTFTVTLYNITGSGTLGFTVKENNGYDLSGNFNLASAPSKNVEIRAPINVVSIVCANENPTARAFVNYTVTFEKPVTGLTAGNFQVSDYGGEEITSVTGEGTTWTVTVKTGVEGALDIVFVSDYGLSEQVNTRFQGDRYFIDKTAPTGSITEPVIAGTGNSQYTFNAKYDVDPGASYNMAYEVITTGEVKYTTSLRALEFSYEILVTVEGAGTISLRLPAGNAIDKAGNSSAEINTPAYAFDTRPPVITVSKPSVSNTINGPVTYTVIYTDTDLSSITLNNDNISLFTTGDAAGTVSVSGTDNVYTVTVSNITGRGTLRIYIPEGTAIDLAGNQSEASSPAAFGTGMTIVRNNPAITNSNTVDYTVTFDTPVEGLTLDNFSVVGNGNVTAAEIIDINGAGTTWAVTVNTGTVDGGISLNLFNINNLSPDLGNLSLPFVGDVYTIDKTAPTLSISTPRVTRIENGDKVEYTITYADANLDLSTYHLAKEDFSFPAVDGFYRIDDIEIGDIINNIQKITFTTIGEGAFAFSIPAGIVSDYAGNPSFQPAVSPMGGTDYIPPVIAISAPSVSSTVNGPVTYTVTYTDDSLGETTLTQANITLIKTDDATGDVEVTGSGDTYTVTVNHITGLGTIGISIAEGTATDLSGNRAPGIDSDPFNVVAATINSITRNSAILTNSATVEYTVNANTILTGLTPANFELVTSPGITGAEITNIENGIITVNTGTGDGYIGINLVNVTGVLPAISTDLTLAGQVYTIDKTPPTVTITNATPAIGNVNTLFNFTVNYSDANLNPDFNSNTLEIIASQDLSIVTFEHTEPQNGTVTHSFTFGGNGAIALNTPEGYVTDYAGNRSPASNSVSFTVDNTLPAITVSSPSVSTTGAGPVTYTVTYADDNFKEATLTADNITLNTTGNALGTVTVTGSGTSYTVTISDIKGTGTLGISIDPGTATDFAGNTADGFDNSETFEVETKLSFAALPLKTYGAADFAPGAVSSNIDVPITYTSDNEAVATIVDGNIHITGAGIAHIKAIQGDAEVIQGLKVAKAILSVKANNQTKPYGAALPVLTATYTGFVNGDNSTGLTTQPVLTTTATSVSPVTTYPITVTGAVSQNYTLRYVAGVLTVGKAPLTITATNQTKTYAAALPTLTVAYSGFVNGESSTSLTTQPVVSTTATAASPATTYPIRATGAAGSNYAITYVAGTLTISKAILTVTADDKTKPYGAVNPALTIVYTGFVNGDTQARLTTRPLATTTATTTSAAGTYPIAVSGGVSDNYTFNYVAGALRVGSVTLTITANSQSKTYGAANPTLTATYSGFINGDTQASLTTLPTLSSTATTASNAGSYTVTASGAVMPGYNIVYIPGTLTVNKAPLTISADNKSKTYGTVNPPLTASYNGFVNGDTQASLTTLPTLTNNTGVNAAPGNYPITTGGAQSANYNINYADGLLAIIPLSNVTLSNLTVSNGSLSPGFATGTTNYTVTVNYDLQYLTFTPTYEATATATINGTAVPNGSASYPLAIAAGTNTITIVITAQNGTTKATYTVTVIKPSPQTTPVTPNNIMSPNGDGKNDNWVIKDIELYPENNVTIYDKGGRKVYSKHAYHNEWDGTFSGVPLPQGTYYYMLDLAPGLTPVKGFITILRNNQ